MGRIKLWRGREETALIKLLIWQSCFDSAPRPSQRALAHSLCVSQPYVCKVMRKAHAVGWDALTRHGRTTFEELEQVRRVTARMRERVPALFAPCRQPEPPQPQGLNPYRAIGQARTLREWEQERRGERRVLFSVGVGQAR
jgi:hypothetical protein